MFIDKSWFAFYRDNPPEWHCPSCGKSVLNLIDDELRIHESAETEQSRGLDAFDFDWVQYRFTATLRCSNPRCKETIAMAGRGCVDQSHIRDPSGDWESVYQDYLTPLFFEPNLKPFSLPENTPEAVNKCLIQAFSLTFANRGVAANQVRVAVEALLDAHGIKSEYAKGNRISLGSRISEHLTPPLTNLKVKLSAVRWIGNAGSHEIDSISIDDLLDGFSLVESVLAELYPPASRNLDALASAIDQSKKPRSHL